MKLPELRGGATVAAVGLAVEVKVLAQWVLKQ
jgi:hypothetical protein